MKRFSRAVALVLVLAVVLTAFGMFSAFAADADDSVAYGEVVFDLDAKTEKKLTVTNGTNGPNMIRNEDGYWEMNYDGFDISTAGSSGDFWLAQAPTSVYINNKYTGSLGSDGVDNRVISNKKNTDYFVIDFDIATKTSFLEGVYFHNRWYNNAGTHSQQNYVQLNGTDTENFYLSTNNGGGHIAPAVTPGEWLNVTIVYDFSAVDEYGYAIPSQWKIYVYMDGIYCGVLPNIKSDATSFWFNRISTDAASKNGADCETLFANFTYKTFKHGYDGPMTADGVLGNAGVTLADLPDLKYALEDTPEMEDNLWATVERVGVEEPIEIYHYDELDASLVDGDVVTLYRSISSPMVQDVNANITWKDVDGNVLTPGTRGSKDKVFIRQYATLDLSAGTIVDDRDLNYLKNNQIAAVTDSLAIGYSSDLKLLKDYVYNAEETHDLYRIDSNGNTVARDFSIDLNGHTLTLENAKRAFNLTAKTLTKVLFKNGTINVAGAELSLLSGSNIWVFENCTVNITSESLFDQRGGTIIYKNCVVNSTRALTDLKGSADTLGALVIDGSTVNVTGASVVYVANSASGGKRMGGSNLKVKVLDSNLTSDTSGLVNALFYANSSGTWDTTLDPVSFVPNEALAVNANSLDVTVDGSKLTLGSSIVTSDVANFLAAYDGKTVDANQQFTLDSNITINNTDVVAQGYIVDQATSGYSDTLLYKDNYKLTTDLTVMGSQINAANAEQAAVNNKAKIAAAVSFNLGAEVGMPSGREEKFVIGETAVVDFNLEPGYQWIRRGVEGVAPWVYTEKIESHAYIYDGHEYEFYGYLGDPANAEGIPVDLPVESSLLKYEWFYNTDGAYEAVINYKGAIKANVSVESDLALNIYLPATFGGDSYEHIYCGENNLPVYDVNYGGEAYKAFTITGIDPTTAAKEIPISFKVIDENGTSAIINTEVSVLDYIQSIFDSDSVSTEGKEVVASLLNYIVKAAVYNAPAAKVDAKLEALMAHDAYKAASLEAPALGEGKTDAGSLGIFSSARLVLDTQFVFELLVKDGFEGEVTFSYKDGADTVSETKALKGGDVVRIALNAYQLTDAITVSFGGASGALDLAGYLGIMPEAEKTDAYLGLVDAILVYNAKAKAYQATL